MGAVGAAACKRAAELNDQLPAVYITLGRIHSGTGLRDLAIQEFQRAQELDHKNAVALLGLGRHLFQRRPQPGSRRSLQKGLSSCVLGLGRILPARHSYYRQRRFPEAADQFRRVIELCPIMARPTRASAPLCLVWGGKTRLRRIQEIPGSVSGLCCRQQPWGHLLQPETFRRSSRNDRKGAADQ